MLEVEMMTLPPSITSTGLTSRKSPTNISIVKVNRNTLFHHSCLSFYSSCSAKGLLDILSMKSSPKDMVYVNPYCIEVRQQVVKEVFE